MDILANPRRRGFSHLCVTTHLSVAGWVCVGGDMEAKAIGLEHKKMQACQNTSGEVKVSHTEIRIACNSKDQLQDSSLPLSICLLILLTLTA